jgi:hypothetical protein
MVQSVKRTTIKTSAIELNDYHRRQTGSDWSGSLLWQTSVTAMLQGLPEKAPCNILPEQEFGATTITESAAASQINIVVKALFLIYLRSGK